MVEKVGLNPAASRKIRIERLWRCLEEAFTALESGAVKDASERAKAVSAMAAADEDIAALEEAVRVARQPETEEEEDREPFLRRLAGYMEPERAAELLARLDAERPKETES